MRAATATSTGSIAILSLVDLKSATFELLQRLHSARCIRIRDFYKAEAARAPRVAFGDQGDFLGGPMGREQSVHTLFGCRERKISDVEFGHRAHSRWDFERWTSVRRRLLQRSPWASGSRIDSTYDAQISPRGGGVRDSVSFPARDASAGRSRRGIRGRFNLRGGVSCCSASTSALLLLLLTRFSRQLPLLACMLIVRLRHEVSRVPKDLGRRSVAGSRSGRRSVGRGAWFPGHQIARLMQLQRRWTCQLATPTVPQDTALMPLSLRGDFLSVNCGGKQLSRLRGTRSFAARGSARSRSRTGCTGSPLDVVRECASHLCHEAPLILRPLASN
jgi:hypothetical protein